jgi:hypothetical protein
MPASRAPCRPSTYYASGRRSEPDFGVDHDLGARTAGPEADHDTLLIAVELNPFEEALRRRKKEHDARLGLHAGPELRGKASLLLGRDEEVPAGSEPRPGVGQRVWHADLVSEVVDERPEPLHRRGKATG